jgi:hypothetical protein
MAVTRINNNQITDASAGNVYVGINANTKIQNYSITAGKIANNLTYGSDLTVSGNLTVNGQSTAIDTTITTIEDPVIVLASTQTGTPAVDIGFLGERGDSDNIAFVWDESSDEFVTAFTSTSETNTTIAITSYANFHTNDANIGGNAVINGTTSLVGNLVGNVNATANITGGNLLTPGLISAVGNITGGNLIADGAIIGNIEISGNINVENVIATGFISAVGNVISGNLVTTGVTDTATLAVSSTSSFTGNITSPFNVTGNIAAGNISTPGLISAVGNITGGNLITTGDTRTGTLETTGNALIGGNLIVNGNISYINIDDLRVEDPIIILGTGPNGAPLTVNDGLDRGIYMEYYISNVGTANAFMGFDNSSGNMFIANDVNFTANDIVGVNSYGTLQAGNLYIQSAVSTGNITGGNLITAGNVYAPAIVNNGTFNTDIQLGAASGIIAVTTNGNSTQFKPSGQIELGGIAQVVSGTFGGSGITLGTSQTDIFQNRDGNVTVQVGTGGATTSTWTFANSGNLLAPGNISAVGNITGANIVGTTSGTFGNIVISGDDITDTNGRVNFNTAGGDVDFAVNGDTVANVFYVDAGTGTASFGSATQTVNAVVAFNATNSILAPVGNTAQRPATGVTGMIRFNTTNNAVEVYDNTQWVSVGVPVFTVIADEQFNGDGLTVAFTLGSTQTTNSCIVSINGVVQIPTLAYSVSGTDPTCVLTFTEAPETGDIIDVRQITTTTSVTSIANSSGNAVIATSETAANVDVTGNLVISGSVSAAGFIGLDATKIANGNSEMAVVSSGGNIRGNVAGTTVMTISPGLVDIVGNLTVSGNATLSGNILGDRIQNGTTSLDIQTPSGNANINIGGTGNLAVFSPGALNMTGNIIPTANITYDLGTTTNRWKDIWLSNSTIYMGNAQISANATSLIFTNPQGGQTVLAGTTSAITGASVSVTGAVTAASVVGGVITGSSTSVTGAQTAASTVGGVITGVSVSLTGNVFAGNVTTATALYVNTSGGATAIVNSAGNGVGNIGSTGDGFNTVFAKATSAQYADLAEKYTADAEYVPGTVVVFGGTHEVTIDAADADRKVAGVVSTNPAYIMNDSLNSEFTATVALTGRVPTMVIGPVHKGDLMVAAGLGRARAEADPKVGTVIGKALEDFDGAEGTIEVVVGRF